MNRVHISEKQKLILYMAYTTYYLPIDVLKNFPKTFTPSNVQYKLIPRLIQTELIERARIGYNKKYGENELQIGKAVYDTLMLTKKGIAYVKKIGNITGNNELSRIRYFYYKTIQNNKSISAEERLKRSVLCDYMFDPMSILAPIMQTASLKPGAVSRLEYDIGNPNKFRYFRALEYKRLNGNLGTLQNLGTFVDSISQTGFALSGSKIFGVINTDSKTVPIYETGYGRNVRMVQERENDLIGKITAYTKKPCNDAVYVYHGVNDIKRLIERKDVEDKWKNQTHIIDIFDFQRIYLIPYGRNSVPFEHLQLQTSIPDKDMTKYWIKNDCFDFHDYILANPYVNETHRNSQDYFISIDPEYNYIIGYLPELRHLRKVFRYYEYTPNAKPLVVVCDESQIEFFKTVFENILEQNKLNFSCSKFREPLGTSKTVDTSDKSIGGDY